MQEVFGHGSGDSLLCQQHLAGIVKSLSGGQHFHQDWSLSSSSPTCSCQSSCAFLAMTCSTRIYSKLSSTKRHALTDTAGLPPMLSLPDTLQIERQSCLSPMFRYCGFSLPVTILFCGSLASHTRHLTDSIDGLHVCHSPSHWCTALSGHTTI